MFVNCNDWINILENICYEGCFKEKHSIWQVRQSLLWWLVKYDFSFPLKTNDVPWVKNTVFYWHKEQMIVSDVLNSWNTVINDNVQYNNYKDHLKIVLN